ncbi:MAG: hemolysin XhlA family protein [Candidatus Gastranaerophilales bacterium]|nr:hemolysin XhlA family protein [Candidatus Gastranaerophilales bacterium]
MLTTIGIIIALIVSIIGLVVQIGAAGIYIGKLEGFKELVNYKFNEQKERLDKHNNFITRIYDLEKKERVNEEQIKVANHRIEDLEGG